MTKPTTQTDSPTTSRRHSLRAKLFIPFVIILLLLGGAATFGALSLIRASSTQTADERLLATQEILYREFKKQEIILQTYAVLLQHFEALAKRFVGTSEVGILQDRLFNTLEESNISVTFYPLQVAPLLPQKSLVALFDQVRRSGQPRFRYTNELGHLPVLMTGAPLYKDGQLEQIMLLHTAMGEQFLHKVADPLQVRVTLMDLDGEILAQSHKDITPPELTPAQVTAVGAGERLYLNVSHKEGGEKRHQISAIPLGSTDLVFLLVETSLARAAETQTQLTIRMLAAILAALLLGMVVYFRIIGNITRPARELRQAANAIARGNFNHHITEISHDELGDVAVAFNDMVNSLEDNYQQRAAKDIEKALAVEEAKHQATIDKKGREFQKLQMELHTQQREMAAIYQLNQAMISATELSVLFDRILQVINETLGCDHLVLLIYNPGDSSLEVAKTAGIDFEVLRNIRFTFDQGITGEVAQSQRLVYVRNLDEDSRSLSYHGQIVTRGSMVSVPLVVKARLVGVMNLHKKLIDGFSPSELKLVQAVSNQTAIAIDNSQLRERTRDLSNTDELTGLANRRHFQEILKREVAQARRFSSFFSIIMCEIDHLQTLTESYGRMRVDALLKQVGQTLLKNTRGIDLVSRFGAEQFVLLLPKTNKDGAFATAEKLRHCIQAGNFDLGEAAAADLTITVSFGVTEFPGDSKNIYELLNLADRALYKARQEGGDATVVWEGPAPGPE